MEGVSARARRAGESGLSLLEVLVCAVLLAFGSAAVSNMLASAFVSTDGNSAKTQASDLAAREMEELRAQDYLALSTRNPATVTSNVTWKGIPFAVQSTVTRDTPAPNMSTIDVTVTWAQRGHTQTYTLNTIYADTRN